MGKTGRYRPDADAIAREFLLPDHAHGFDPGLGRTVVALPSITDARNTGNIHYHTAVAALDHVRSSFTRAQEYSAEIHGDDRIPLIHRHASDHRAVLHFYEQAVAHDPRIVHETVQPAEVGRDTRHGGGDFTFIGDVHGVSACLHRLGRAQLFRLFEVIRIQIEKSEICTVTRELQGYRSTDAASCPGHHNCLVTNIHDASFTFPTVIPCLRAVRVRSFGAVGVP